MTFQEQNTKQIEQIKSLEEKNSNFKYQISTYKTQLKDKEYEVNRIKSDLLNIEKFRNEKDKNDKTIRNLNATIVSLKEDLERKSNKLREIQRINYDLKQRLETFENKNNQNFNVNFNNTNKNRNNKNEIILKKELLESNEFEKEKKIKSLENENVKLRNQIIKLNDDLINKADNQLANFEREFNNKNTNDNLNSEINQLILGIFKIIFLLNLINKTFY